MPSFSHLIRFEAEENHAVYFADLGPDANGPPTTGIQLPASKTIDGLAQKESTVLTVGRLLPPLPRDDLPIYCVGLNYRSHAKEAKVEISTSRMLRGTELLKRCGSLIFHPVHHCGQSQLHLLPAPKKTSQSTTFAQRAFWTTRSAHESFLMIVISTLLLVKLTSCVQGELVFVTSREAKDVSVADAKEYILGYTIGNDISCRMYQLPKYSAGQFFFAKAFDKFA